MENGTFFGSRKIFLRDHAAGSASIDLFVVHTISLKLR